MAINPFSDGDRNNLKTTVANSAKPLYRSLSRFAYFTGLLGFYTYYSFFTAYAEDSDDERENNEEPRHRHKDCFAVKRGVSKLENLAKTKQAKKWPTIRKLPTMTCDPATRSRQVCS